MLQAPFPQLMLSRQHYPEAALTVHFCACASTLLAETQTGNLGQDK
jgi:hypothetical protein